MPHFAFADDLFIFSAAKTRSFEVSKRTLEDFGKMFGL